MAHIISVYSTYTQAEYSFDGNNRNFFAILVNLSVPFHIKGKETNYSQFKIVQI